MKLDFGKNIIGDGYPVCIIAEAAVEHIGNLGIAKKMVDIAEDAGVDFIKFQYHMPDMEMLPDTIQFWGGNMDSILDNFNLKHDDHKKLIDYCKDKKVQYLCTPFCPDAVKKLDELGVIGFKTGSGELTNLPLFEEIKSTNKPVIVSTGMATDEEIDRTFQYLKENKMDFMFMNCTSVYPCPYDQVYLKNILRLSEKYNVVVGHSDHTDDIISSIAATSIGAKAIEKHFTMSKLLGGPDASVSLEPKELINLVEKIRLVERANNYRSEMSNEELKTKSWANHSIVSTRLINKGEKITNNDITVKRPSGGIPANKINDVIGSIAKFKINKNEQITFNNIKM